MKNKSTMNRIRRIIPLFMALWLCLGISTGWGQTSFTATYTFPADGADGNVSSFAYNGTSYTGILPGNIVKTGITTSSSGNNFRATNWPTGAISGSDVFSGVVDLDKYIGFTIAAVPGYKFTITSITFGVGRSATGPRQWQWRGSADTYGSVLQNYTSVNAGLTNTSGVLTNPDSNSSWTGNVLAVGSSYQDVTTSVGFRIYAYNSEAAGGTAGLQGPITIEGTFEALPDPALAAIPSSLSDFDYYLNLGPSAAKTFTVSGINLVENVSVETTGNFEISTSEAGVYSAGPIILPQIGGVLTNTLIYTRMVEGLAVGSYTGEAIVSSGATLSSTVSLSGDVIPPLSIPYSNPFRNTDDRDDAIDDGFIFNILSVETGGGGYMRFGLNGYIETPVIDFTPYDQLQVQFDATTYGGLTGQVVASLISGDGGSAFDAIGVATLTTSYQTYTYIIDLTGIYNVPNGKLRFEMTDGTNSVRFRDFSITLVPVSTPVFDPPAGTFLSTVVPVNVEIETATVGADLLYSTTSAVGPWITYTGSIPISESTTIWAYGVKDEMADSDVASAEYIIADLLAVNDIAELRSMYSAPATKANPVVYQLTNEVFLTLQSTFRNQKYIQDASGAILIDDADGNITTTYGLYDGITGIIGSLSMFNGMLQFIPISDPGPATSANTPAVVPVTVRTLSAITSADQAKLLKILSVSFDATGNFPVATSTNYAITDPSVPGTGIFRTQYFDPTFNYMGQPIPELPKHITAVMNESSGSFRLIARDLTDFSNPVISSIPPAGTFGVPYGTPEAAALAALPATTIIIDDGGAEWVVPVSWSIVAYNPELITNFTAIGTFTLPEGIDQSDPETALVVQGIVAVSAQLPLSRYGIIVAMLAMLIAAGVFFRRRMARS